jgi:hypothetical protein
MKWLFWVVVVVQLVFSLPSVGSTGQYGNDPINQPAAPYVQDGGGTVDPWG